MRFPAALLVAAALLALPASLPGQIPASERWRTFDTEHFRVHFAEGLEPVARRAAAYAEEGYAALTEAYVRPPAGRIELLVADNVDFANGTATPIPRNRVLVYAREPVDEMALAHHDDWMRLVVIHELAHIFHLDHAEGFWRWGRRILGRSPILFPQAFTPLWLIEGIATHYESVLTHGGRVDGTHFDMILRAAALEDRLFRIDRVTGLPTRWPGGQSAYAYGAHFLSYLAETEGAEAVAELTRELGRVPAPYLIERAARRSLGRTFPQAWDAWRQDVVAAAGGQRDTVLAAGVTEPEPLTGPRRQAHHPRYLADGSLLFVAATGREEPSVRRLDAAGETPVAPVTSLDAVSEDPATGALYWTDLEWNGRERILSDVFRSEGGWSRERVTRGARLRDLDVHPAGGLGVAVQGDGGVTAPVLVDLESGEVRPLVDPEPGVRWMQPRWAPEGERIAIAWWRQGGRYDIALLDTAGVVTDSFGETAGVASAPTWTPDGGTVIYGSDRDGIPNLYARDLATGADHRVTNVVTGAFQPDVSPDGRWIAFSHYSADGFGIARIPLDRDGWGEMGPARTPAPVAVPPADVLPEPAGGASRPYSARETGLPTSWIPALESGSELGLGLGALVFGGDVIQRHGYTADLVHYPADGRTEAGIRYDFLGWEPAVLAGSAAQRWSVWQREPRDAAGDPIGSAILRREQRVGAGARFVFPGMRRSYSARLAVDVRRPTYHWADPEPVEERGLRLLQPRPSTGLSLTLGRSSVRRYAFSVSPEEGTSLSVQADGRRHHARPDREEEPLHLLRLNGLVHTFQPFDTGAFARHALAGRLAVGAELGGTRGGYALGGPDAPSILATLPGAEAEAATSHPLRGYPQGVQVGDRVVSGVAEYRIPLRLVERGIRTAPVFLDRVWGTVFTDAGAAWCAGGELCPAGWNADERPRPLASAGAELVARFRLGYFANTDLRGGMGIPLVDTEGQRTGRPEFYLRVGTSF